MAWRNKPCCERCFIENHDPITFGAVPTITKAPWQIEQSVRKVELCYSCGEYTIVGIYVRVEVDDDDEDTAEDALPIGALSMERPLLEGPL